MKKNYSTPETQSLEVMAHEMLCASGDPAVISYGGTLGTMGQTNGSW